MHIHIYIDIYIYIYIYRELMGSQGGGYESNSASRQTIESKLPRSFRKLDNRPKVQIRLKITLRLEYPDSVNFGVR